MSRPVTFAMIAIGFLLTLASHPTALAEVGQGDAQPVWPQRWLPVDAGGWSVLKPSSDSRLIYVSQDGDDATAKPYSPSDKEVGADPFKPTQPIKAYKTIAVAMRQMRAQHPDWLLLRRGDTWKEVLGTLPSGRNGREPAVVCAYGTGVQRPVISPPKRQSCFSVDSMKGFHDLAVVSVEFCYSPTFGIPANLTVDPNEKPVPGVFCCAFRTSVSSKEATGERVLVEDCCLRGEGCIFQNTAGGTLKDIVVRRNLVLETPHSGAGVSGHISLLLEENVFDLSGWMKPTIFHHTTYFSCCYEVIFRGNLFLRASAIGNKWTANKGTASSGNLVMDDNLYAECEYGITPTGNLPGALRFKNVRITNNVLLDIGRNQARPKLRGGGLYVEVRDIDGGLVASNVILHRPDDRKQAGGGIGFGSYDGPEAVKYEANGVHYRNLTIRHNFIRNAGIFLSWYPRIQKDVAQENVRILNNAVEHTGGLKGCLVRVDGPRAGGAGPVYWTSDPVAVDIRRKEYSVEYARTGDDVEDMRLTILFQGSGNKVYFDKAVLKSERNIRENNNPWLAASLCHGTFRRHVSC